MAAHKRFHEMSVEERRAAHRALKPSGAQVKCHPASLCPGVPLASRYAADRDAPAGSAALPPQPQVAS